jgi:cell division protein ZapA
MAGGFLQDRGCFIKAKQDINNFSTLQIMDELIAATVVIGDRSYRIKVSREDEETVRKTAKIINDKVIEFKTQFAGKDMQDYVSMVLLWFATEQASEIKAGYDGEAVAGHLQSIENILDNHLIDK